jgi:erythronate-4-phosphate dehydrogenase
LTKTGNHPTYQLVNAQSLALLKSNSILLNTGRGAVIDNHALLQFLEQKPDHLAAVVLDVWDGEPLVNRQLVDKVAIATPHIAGYSLEGKWRGTEQVYNALCQFLGQQPQHQLADFLPQQHARLSVVSAGNNWATAYQLAIQAYPIINDDAAFRATMALTEQERALAFDGLRKHYWPRREFAAYQLSGQLDSQTEREMIKNLGFLA